MNRPFERWSIVIAAIVVSAAGVTLVALPRDQEWTTSSPEALSEFEAGDDAQRKVYFQEAREHFQRAYEIDPEFVMAKWRYAGALRLDDPEAAEVIFEELMKVETSGLSPREKFFILGHARSGTTLLMRLADMIMVMPSLAILLSGVRMKG